MSGGLLWAVKKVTKVYIFKKSSCEMFRIFFHLLFTLTMWFMKLQINFENMKAGFLLKCQNTNMNSNCSNLLDLRNLQEQVRKAFCFKNCIDLSLFKSIVLFSDLKSFVNSWLFA